MTAPEALRRIIAQSGPLSVADYMTLCLSHPDYGYYNTRDPLGSAGDFTTAPEITQVFGELIGVWCAQVWDMMGRPQRFALIEFGPGRGTLMSDLLRAAGKLAGFAAAADVHFVEISPPLRALQQQAMERAGRQAAWHRAFDTVAPGPCIVIANEFFDALACHQFVKGPDGWRERLIACRNNCLQWTLAQTLAPRGAIPNALADATDGAIFERAPAREALAAAIGQRIAAVPGAALIVDYGFSGPALGDTLQALAAHEFADPLAVPGKADLTTHVDFSALREAAASQGCAVAGPISQAELLTELGIGLRMDALKRRRPDKVADLDLAAARLVSPDQMGALFQALTFSSVGVPPPFAAH